MVHQIFTVYDNPAKSYLLPFFAQNTAVAIRIFEAAIQDPNHQFNRFSEDYTLFLIGEYDDDNAETAKKRTPEKIIGAWEVKARMEIANEIQAVDPGYTEEIND